MHEEKKKSCKKKVKKNMHKGLLGYVRVTHRMLQPSSLKNMHMHIHTTHRMQSTVKIKVCTAICDAPNKKSA